MNEGPPEDNSAPEPMAGEFQGVEAPTAPIIGKQRLLLPLPKLDA